MKGIGISWLFALALLEWNCATRGSRNEENPISLVEVDTEQTKPQKKYIPATDDCEVPSFACSGGSYGSELDFGAHTFAFESHKLSTKITVGDDPAVPASQVVLKRLQAKKDSKHFVLAQITMNTALDPSVIDACYDDSGTLLTSSGPYWDFLQTYTPSLEAGVVDYLIVGEELIPGHRVMKLAVAMAEDLRSRFPKVKLGFWPSSPIGPYELKLDERLVDFYVYDFYEFIYNSPEAILKGDPLHDPLHPHWDAFASFEKIGKPWFLVLTATPSVAGADFQTTMSQIRMANDYNIPILFFAVSETGSAPAFESYIDEVHDFPPHQHLMASVLDLQSILRSKRLPVAPLLDSNFKLGKVMYLTESPDPFKFSFVPENSDGYLTFLNTQTKMTQLRRSLPLTLTEEDNSVVVFQLFSKTLFVPTEIKVIFKDNAKCSFKTYLAGSGVAADVWIEGSSREEENTLIYTIAEPRPVNRLRLRLEPKNDTMHNSTS